MKMQTMETHQQKIPEQKSESEENASEMRREMGKNAETVFLARELSTFYCCI